MEKPKKTAVFYFDAQNLYRRAKSVFADVRHPKENPYTNQKRGLWDSIFFLQTESKDLIRQSHEIRPT